LLPAGPAVTGYYCQQDPVTVDPELRAGPTKVGSCCHLDLAVVGPCCHQNPVVLAGSVLFEIRACNWARGNWLTRRVNLTLRRPGKNPVEFFFFNFFPLT